MALRCILHTGGIARTSCTAIPLLKPDCKVNQDCKIDFELVLMPGVVFHSEQRRRLLLRKSPIHHKILSHLGDKEMFLDATTIISLTDSRKLAATGIILVVTDESQVESDDDSELDGCDGQVNFLHYLSELA
jgi:hypothetical protein